MSLEKSYYNFIQKIKMYYLACISIQFSYGNNFSFRYNFRDITCSKPRLICIFSLFLYCFDTGSDYFVGIDLFIRCHWRFGTSVILTTLLPGLCHGLKKHFKDDGSFGDSNFLYYLFIYPLRFIPKTFWKLVQSVIKSEEGYNGDKQLSTVAEDKAKK